MRRIALVLGALLAGGPASAVPPPPAAVRVELTPVSGDARRPAPLEVLAQPMDIVQKRAGGVPHPEALSGYDRFVAPWYGFGKVVIGFGTPPAGAGPLAVGADLDQDGTLAPEERGELSWDGKAKAWMGVLKGRLERQDLDRAAVSIPVTVALSAHRDGNALRVTWALERVRAGRLPDGRAVHAVSAGGVFDSDHAALVVDRNGDGTPDHGDLRARWTSEHGVVAGVDGGWRFRIGADGAAMDLEPIPATAIAAKGPRLGEPAPVFPVTDLDGVDRSLDTWSGQWLILDFWASWCGPCRAQHPDLQVLAAAHDVAVLGVAQDDVATMRAVLAKSPLPWPNAAIGADSPIVEGWSVTGIPKYALLGPDGRVVAFGGLDTLRHALLQHRSGIQTR